MIIKRFVSGGSMRDLRRARARECSPLSARERATGERAIHAADGGSKRCRRAARARRRVSVAIGRAGERSALALPKWRVQVSRALSNKKKEELRSFTCSTANAQLKCDARACARARDGFKLAIAMFIRCASARKYALIVAAAAAAIVVVVAVAAVTLEVRC